jgi:hypothetical protein
MRNVSKKINSSGDEQFYLLGYNIIQSVDYACYLLRDSFLLGLFFDPESGGDIFLRNATLYVYPRIQNSS